MNWLMTLAFSSKLRLSSSDKAASSGVGAGPSDPSSVGSSALIG
jgi:hypothetical protein